MAKLTRISLRADALNAHRARPATKGVDLVMATENNIAAIVAGNEEYQRRDHSESVRRGMRAAAQRGFYVFARAPYGYRKVPIWDNGVRRYKLELDPPASDTVRRIFDQRLEGAMELEITAELNASGVNSPAVAGWSVEHVRRILGNEVYCGTAVAAKQDMAKPETAVRTPNAFPAIVTQQEFDQVQRMPWRPVAQQRAQPPPTAISLQQGTVHPETP